MMKARSVLFLFILLTLATVNSFAQELTLTTTAANTVASKVTIDLPALSNNPNAIIVATLLGNTQTLNPHPIGAWYYNNKWHIFNTDHATMPVGLTFKVEVFLNPDANHFLHVITDQNGEGYSYIDNPALNNNPTAQVRIFQNHAPDNRAFRLNPNEARIIYDGAVGKWYIQNVNLTALHANTAYNIVIAPGGASRTTPNINKPISNIPTSNLPPSPTASPTPSPTASPTGNAGGDLSGTYPNPTVQKILGRNLSSTAPKIGQTLKWNGSEWIPTEDNVAGSTPANPAPPQIQTFFMNGGVQRSPQIGFGNTHIITQFSHSIVLAKKSRLIISAIVNVEGPSCELVCDGTQGVFTVRINGSYKMSLKVAAPQNSQGSATIANFMIDLNAGTYDVDFVITHSPPSSAMVVTGGYSSVMVIPLE